MRVKGKLGIAVLCVLAAATLQAKTILPDACGDDKVKFEIKTEKDHAAPGAPNSGKAQLVLIEALDKTFCWGCSVATRFGMDGAWVGANNGDSYFVLSIDRGEHHLCADWQSVFGTLKKKIGLTSFTAEAGKVYYFEALVTQKQTSKDYVDRDLDLKQLNDDEGKFRIKASRFSTSTPTK